MIQENKKPDPCVTLPVVPGLLCLAYCHTHGKSYSDVSSIPNRFSGISPSDIEKLVHESASLFVYHTVDYSNWAVKIMIDSSRIFTLEEQKIKADLARLSRHEVEMVDKFLERLVEWLCTKNQITSEATHKVKMARSWFSMMTSMVLSETEKSPLEKILIPYPKRR